MRKYWAVVILGCCYTGVLLYWGAVILGCCYTGVLLYWGAVILGCCYTGVLLYWGAVITNPQPFSFLHLMFMELTESFLQ